VAHIRFDEYARTIKCVKFIHLLTADILAEPSLVLLGQNVSSVDFVHPARFDGLCSIFSSLEYLPKGTGKGAVRV
jgi:hypothetical protein